MTTAKKTKKATTKQPRIQDIVDVHLVTDGESRGWAHTHGMERLGLPNLQIFGIPLFMGPAAAGILNSIADYMVTSGKKVEVGQKMGLGPNCYVLLEKNAPPVWMTKEEIESHYDHERWTVVDIPEMAGKCAGPGHMRH
jgi:hypothetical protein